MHPFINTFQHNRLPDLQQSQAYFQSKIFRMPRSHHSHEWTEKELLVLLFFSSRGLTTNQVAILVQMRCGGPLVGGVTIERKVNAIDNDEIADGRQPLFWIVNGKKAWFTQIVEEKLFSYTDDNDEFDRLTHWGDREAEAIGEVSPVSRSLISF